MYEVNRAMLCLTMIVGMGLFVLLAIPKDYQVLRKVVETGVKAAEWLVWPVDPEHPEWGGISFKEFPNFAFWPYTYACSGHLADTIAHHGTEAHVKRVSWEPKLDLPCVMCTKKAKETDERATQDTS